MNSVGYVGENGAAKRCGHPFRAGLFQGEVSGTQRRRAFASLRKAHSVLGLNRDKLALGPLFAATSRPALAAAVAGVVAIGAMPTAASASDAVCVVPGTNTPNGTTGEMPGKDATDQVACGQGAEARGGNAVAIGYYAKATGGNSVAIGDQSQATNTDALAFGSRAIATGVNSLAIGNQVKVAGQNGIAIVGGSDESFNDGKTEAIDAASVNSIVIGGWSQVKNSDQAVAFGRGAIVTNADNAMALGFDARANHADSVALGAKSTTAAVVNTANGTVGGQTYNYAGTDAIGTISVGSGDAVNGVRTVTNVAAGRVSETSTDAINGSQLHATNQAVDLNADNIAVITNSLGGDATVNPDGTVTGPTYTFVDGSVHNNVGDALYNIDGRVTDNSTAITNLTNGTAGMVQQAAPGEKLTVGKDTDGLEVDFAGTAGDRVLTGVAAGNVAEDSTDAVNGSQLHATNQNVGTIVDSLGGGAKVNPDGTVTGPTYVLNGNTYNNVGDALTDVDGRVTNVEGDITNLTTGKAGLVQQAGPGAELTVGKDTDGLSVNFTGIGGDRVLTGVAPGRVSSISNDAINGSQLYGVSQSVADALGGGSTVNPDGSVSAPSYNVGGETHNNVGDALANVDDRVNNIEGDIANITNGKAGLVQQEDDTAPITVGKDSGGNLVDVSGTEGDRVISGVADGKIAEGSSEAVNGGQLWDMEQRIKDGTLGALDDTKKGLEELESMAVTYDDASKSSVTLAAGQDPVKLQNVAAGEVSETSTDAVNGGQLYAVQQEAHSYTDSQVNLVRNELGGQINTINVRLDDLTRTVDKNRKAASAGIASVAAMANIPQAINPGKVLVGGGVGYRDGQAAFALGVSGRMDNDKSTFKASVGVDSRDVTLGFGIGHEF